MATTNILDLTQQINSSPKGGQYEVIIDVGEYISGAIYLMAGDVNSEIRTSNYGGEEEGTLNPSPLTADNFVLCEVLDLYNNIKKNSFNGSYIGRFNRVGRYLKIISGDNVNKLIIQLYKII